MTTPLTRLTTALADRYRLERELGAGGMATVYLARDVRHNRQVALKVLHPELSAVLGPERFLKEIELTANLQHPHILPLFDSGDADGQLFYVMPFVEGETLRARLDRECQLPVADALALAREVAGALQYAHDRGIIHRDIKPENILLQGGHALVADFGIALAVQQAGGQRMTQTGLSLGTPQYMAPEQAMGERSIDARADIYALGAVTYEMLTGEPPFTGPTSQAIVARVLTVPPAPPTQTRSTVPAHVEAAVLTALQKLPADRFASAQKFADALHAENAVVSATAQANAAPSGRSARRTGVPGWLFALVSALAVAALGLWWRGRDASAPPALATRFTLALPDSLTLAPLNTQVGVAVSPDGREFLFPAIGQDGTALYRRRLDGLDVQAVSVRPGTGNPTYSPDGAWLGLEDGAGRLVRVPLAGGNPVVIDSGGSRLSWGDGDRLVFLRNGALWMRDGRDGTPRAIATPGNGERFAYPFVLPGGKYALANIAIGGAPSPNDFRIVVVSLESGAITTVPLQGAQPRFLAPDLLLFSRLDQSLHVVRFDPATPARVGQPVVALENIFVRTGGGALYGVSRKGVLAYINAGGVSQPVLVRDGKAQPIRIDPALGVLTDIRATHFAPGGRQFIIMTDPGGFSTALLLGATDTGDLQPFIKENARIVGTTWSGDGRDLIWAVQPLTGPAVIKRKAGNGAGGTEVIYTLPAGERLYNLSGCGPRACVLIRVLSPASGMQIREITLSPTVTSRTLARVEYDGRMWVSPDGRWLATNDAERRGAAPSLYVFDLQAPDRRVLVSGAVAPEVAWLPDGISLAYRAADRLLTATLDTGDRLGIARRDTLGVGAWARIAPGPLGQLGALVGALDVRSGTMLGSIPSTSGAGASVVVVTDWISELRRRLAAADGR